jgi:cytochrome P450
VKGEAVAKLSVLIGRGLFTSEGAFWLRQRRLAQPAFHRERLAGFAATMVTATEAMLERWGRETRLRGALDVAAEMSALTLEIVGRTLFSRDLTGEAETVGRALLEALELMNDRTMSVVATPLWWPTWRNARLRRAIRELDRTVLEIIAARRRDGVDRGDLLSMLLQVRDEEDGRGMTDRQLRDEVMTFVLAGHETTAVALSWTWLLLDRHPHVADRLREEVGAAIGDRAPTVADLPRLVYARQVVQKAMRLFPPVWGFMRQATVADRIGGFTVPKRAMITICPWVTYRHAAFWPDPERFDPERFAPEQVAARRRFAYIPFGGGPRLCIGNEFALMEAQLVLAMAVRRYRLRLAPRQVVVPECRLTLRPRGGLAMTLERA